jgi:hypothetical protein
MQLPLYRHLDSGTAANVTAQALVNTSSVESIAAANSIASSLSADSNAGLEVQPSDVTILQAQVVELGPSNFSVHVTATIYVYSPAAVHRGDIISAAAAAGAQRLEGRGRRALSVCSSVTPTTPAAATSLAVTADFQTMTSSLRQLAAAVTHEAHVVQHSALTKNACGSTSSCIAAGRRRLLQATDAGIAAQLASVTAAATSSLAPTSVTGQQTSAAVDPVVVSAFMQTTLRLREAELIVCCWLVALSEHLHPGIDSRYAHA